ncbi:MAG: hypothetical protein V4526_01285 [Patescibacteria group bacterium]
MESRSKKFEIAIVIAALIILVAVWAINGFEDTWMYLTAFIIFIPASWFFFSKKNKDQ